MHMMRNESAQLYAWYRCIHRGAKTSGGGGGGGDPLSRCCESWISEQEVSLRLHFAPYKGLCLI